MKELTKFARERYKSPEAQRAYIAGFRLAMRRSQALVGYVAGWGATETKAKALLRLTQHLECLGDLNVGFDKAIKAEKKKAKGNKK